MKKLIAIVLSTLMLALCFACAAPAAAPAPEAPAAEADPAPAAEAEAPVEAPAEAPAEEATDDDWAYISGKGNLVIGITLFQPMNYYDDSNTLIGFETEFAQAVCEKLGLTPEFVEINWDTKEIELAAKSIDCIWNGMTVTPERKENMSFTQSYIANRQIAVVKAENAANYSTVESLASASLVAEISSAGESAILNNEALAANYTAVAKQADALMEVKSGTADVAVLDYVMARAMIGEGTDYEDLVIVNDLTLSTETEEYGIGLRLGSSATAKIDETIDAMIADGSLNAIAEKYGLSDVLLANQ